ncbi:uncharacterized protein LOC101849344 [Aplysia californica]|uniref:Uncharacterized protein LOC101849344 n=1 Tax=Aplysia californica TaxID=6500 RepID=A0ABM0K9Y7_APLCA|nr:uncharacterized protein LOC101849344 [Aplysia californica]
MVQLSRMFVNTTVRTVVNLVNTDTSTVIEAVILFGFSLPISLFGLVSNVINIVVFLKIGVKDPVSVSLVGLFVADFVFLLLAFYRPVAELLVWSGAASSWVIHPKTVQVIAASYVSTFYLVSTLLTTYISLARCLCVALAFKFQRIFTLTQARLVVVSIYVFAGLSHVPQILAKTLVWRYKAHPDNTTSSFLVLTKSSNFESLWAFHNIVNRTVVPYSCLAICVLCLIVLSVKLRSASEFRSHATTATTTTTTTATPNSTRNRNTTATNCADDFSQTSEKPKTKPQTTTSNLNVKEIQLMKAVFLLCAIFVSTATIRAAMGLALAIFPQLQTHERYKNVHTICTSLVAAFMAFNCAVNFFIFYFFNTKYRQTLGVFYEKV